MALNLPGKSERRLAAAIFLTAILPLVAAILLADSLFSRAAAVWFNPEVGVQLDRGVAVYKDYAAAIKADLRHQGDAIAAAEPLRAAARARDGEKAEAALTAAFSRYPELVSLEVHAEDGAVIARRDRGRPVDEAHERSLEVVRPLGDDDAGPSLKAMFAVDRERLDELERGGAVVARYHQLEAARDELYGGYMRAFAVLLSLTIAVALASGIVLARGVTRRINRLARALDLVGRGDLSVRVPVTGSDELTELASTFNHMLTDMQRSQTRIAYLERVGAWQEMAQRLAHEIKNPLTPIQLAVQECHRKYDGQDARFRALLDTTREIVEEEVGTLRRLVGDFSAFARLPHVEPVESDLREFLADCKDQLGHLHDASGQVDGVLADAVDPDAPSASAATVRWELPAHALPAAIDRQLLRRVVVNLVRNASQAIRDAGRGSGQVVVSARREADASLAITVEDDGPGVAKEARNRIFEPYFTTKADGTGLGLAIVKKIVVEHGGTIEVGKSERLGGASFVIRLPSPSDVSAEAARDARARAREAGVREVGEA